MKRFIFQRKIWWFLKIYYVTLWIKKQMLCFSLTFPWHWWRRVLQHLFCLSWPWTWCGNDSHDLIPKYTEQCALQWLGHEVTDHIASGTPLHSEFPRLYTIRYEIKSDVDVLGPLTTWSLPILLQQNGAQVFLEEDLLVYAIALGRQKIYPPHYLW